MEDPKYKKDKQLNEKISLFRGDITKLEVDAIVNAGEWLARVRGLGCHFVTFSLGGVPKMGGRHLAPESLSVAVWTALLAPQGPSVAATRALLLLKP